jgi:hypothetical protein
VINSDEYHLHRFQTFPISLTSLVINVPYNDGFYLKHNELLEVPGLNHLVNLTKLDLARNVIHYAPLPSLPPALLKLRTGDLSHPIKRGALPASLKMLNIVGGLKCSIEDGALPDGLTHLRISSMRGHEFMKYHVPRSLRYLQLSVGNEVPVDDFAAFIAALPDSVEVLHISDLMQVVSVSKWPASLRRLHVTTTSITRLLTSGQHEIIRPISKFKFAPFARKFKSLHINNITYERSLHRRTASQSKRHMYRFATGQSRLTLDCFGDATVDVHRLLQ